jgi:GNAT superfamily N-acetyltransferase
VTGPRATKIRKLGGADYDSWIELWSEYLRFYRVEIGEQVTRRTFERLSEAQDGMLGLVATDADGQLVGLANLVFHPSTWALTSYCYLEDLFVAPSARGGDVARELIEATGETAGERGAEQVYWHTQQFNGAARSLYDTVGTLTSMVVYERKL